MGEEMNDHMTMADDHLSDTEGEGDVLDSLLGRWESLTEQNRDYDIGERLNMAWDIEDAIRIAGWAEEPIPWTAASSCLVRYIDTATPEEYAALLSCFPEGEYAGRCVVEVDWNVPGKRLVYVRAHVQGTLVSLAVALNRPEILRILLARGHDVNSASYAATSALVRTTGGSMKIDSGVPCSISDVHIIEAERHFRKAPKCNSVTPLAVAVMMGYEECARILLEHGAWTESNDSVSWAMNLGWREQDERYQTVRKIVLGHGEPSSHRPVLKAMRDSSDAQYRAALEAYTYTVEEYDQLLEQIFYDTQDSFISAEENNSDWRKICGKMREIGKVCADALIGRWGTKLIFCGASMENFAIEPLLPYLKGRKLDVTEIPWTYFMARQSKKLIAQLSEHCELVADRCNLEIFVPSVTGLKAILRYVTFYDGPRKRPISELTQAILRCKNAKFVRTSLEKGFIRESTKDLLCWLQNDVCSELAREAVLATRRDPSQILEDWSGSIETYSYNEDLNFSIANAGGMYARCDSRFADCLNGSLEVPKDFLMNYRDISILFFDQSGMFTCTALCAAALCGHNELIKVMLDESITSPEEWKDGLYSTWDECFESRFIDPVLAAALNGHWDTVKLLLERGARLHWDDQLVREFWKQKRSTDLVEEARLHLGDWAVAR